MYLQSELQQGWVPAADLTTWTYCFGDRRLVGLSRERARIHAWQLSDQEHYMKILTGRVGGKYRLTDDVSDNAVDDTSYPYHCVAWHYVAPVVFAVSSLQERVRYQGKLAALTRRQEHECEPFSRYGQRRDFILPPLEEWLSMAEAAVMSVYGSSAITSLLPEEPTCGGLMTAIAFLRGRLAAYHYLANPPSGLVTYYLWQRECRDLRNALSALTNSGIETTKSVRG